MGLQGATPNTEEHAGRGEKRKLLDTPGEMPGVTEADESGARSPGAVTASPLRPAAAKVAQRSIAEAQPPKRRKRIVPDDDEIDDYAADDDDGLEHLDSSQPQEPEEFLGTVRAEVVGWRFYNGMIGDNEYAVVSRQPDNKYDRNACLVTNVNGDSLGHIPAKNGLAALLSPLLAVPDVRVAVLVPRGDSTNGFTLPIHISLHGPKSVSLIPSLALNEPAGCAPHA